ncbi:MAG: ATP-binding protein [Planctomycetes bacterium]|nr:ATP-binding protein [Planctomycetota bacterium]
MEMSDLERAIGTSLKGRHRPIAGALFTYALEVRTGGATALITGRCMLLDEPPAPARPLMDYKNLILGEEWIAGEEPVLDRLNALFSGTGQLGGRAILATGLRKRFSERILPRGFAQSDIFVGNVSGWPEHRDVIEMQIDDGSGQAHASFSPVVAHGLRPYRSGKEAATDWVWSLGGPLPAQQEVPYLCNLVVILPDTRGRFAHMRWLPEGRVTARVDRTVPPDELEVQLLEHTVRGDARWHRLDGEWDAPVDCAAVELFLVHAHGTLLDHVKLDRPGAELSADVRLPTTVEQAELDTRAGEDERVEFKTFVETGHEKEGELLETVIAFANSAAGGRLYLGVEDDGTPSRRAKLAKATGGDPRTAQDALVNRVRRLVRETIKPVPDVEVEWVELFGEPVLVMRVKAGEDPPYSLQDSNEVFVRKGASNRRPDPKTELPALLERSADRRRRRA